MISEIERKELIDLATEAAFKFSNPNPIYLKVKIEEYPHIFFLGCVMDRQIQYERAFDIPYIVAKQIGYDFINFANKSKEFYIDFFQTKNLHRFNKTMAECFYYAIQKIKTEYESNASNIWKNFNSSTELVNRLKSFKGVGSGIANMIVNILQRRGYIDTDKKGIDLSPDRNVKRVFLKMGLISKDSENEAIKIARKLSPEFPGLLDKLFWYVGKNYCLESSTKCNVCVLKKLCKH